MGLINQGLIPPDNVKPTPNKYRSLRNGFLCIGIAVGPILGVLITRLVLPGMESRFFVLAGCVLLFLGIAYVAFYMVIKDKYEEDEFDA